MTQMKFLTILLICFNDGTHQSLTKFMNYWLKIPTFLLTLANKTQEIAFGNLKKASFIKYNILQLKSSDKLQVIKNLNQSVILKLFYKKSSRNTSHKTMISLQSLTLSQQNHISHQRIWSLYLDSVDFFNHKNNSTIEKKSLISRLLIRKFKIEDNFCEKCQNQIEQILKPIFECLFHLLTYCFQAPFDGWKRRNLTRIICMLMIMGWTIPKKLLTDIRYYLVIQIPPKDSAQIFLRYMQWLVAEQIQLNLHFSITNTKCIKELETNLQTSLSEIKRDQNELRTLHGYYKAQRKQRKMLEQNTGHTKIFNLLLSILQFEENHGINSHTDHSQLINEIDHLQVSDFKTKTLFKVVKTYLWTWVLIRIGQAKIRKPCSNYLINKAITQIQQNSNNHSITPFSIFYIQKVAPGKIFKLLKEKLQCFDKIIGYPKISQHFFYPQRLLLAASLKDEQTFSKIIEKILSINEFQMHHFDLFEEICIKYVRIFKSSIEPSKKHIFRRLVLQKLEPKINDFIMFFFKNAQSVISLWIRERFSSMIIKISDLKNLEYQEGSQILQQSTLYQNRYVYLGVLECLVSKYKQRGLIRNYIILKVKLLFDDRKVMKLVDFMQNQKFFNMAEFNPKKSHDEEYLLIAYNVSKAKQAELMSQDPMPYRLKLAQLFQLLPFHPSYAHLFMQDQLINEILAIKHNPQTIVSIFKTATEFTTKNPKKFTFKFLIYYMRKMHSNYKQTIKKEVQELRLVFDKLRKTCNFDQPNLNPYLIMFVYLNESLLYQNSQELAALQSLIPKVFDFLDFEARQLTIAAFYYMELLGCNYKPRKKLILERKLYKAWCHIDSFEKSNLGFDFPPPCSFSLNNVEISHNAGQKIKEKMYGYFENIEVKNLLLIKEQKAKREPMKSLETGNILLNYEGKLHIETSKDHKYSKTKTY